jgi:hypothetical protein
MRYITIDLWEYLLLLLYMVALGFVMSRRKNIEIRKYPEYKYYLIGVYVKVLGGFMFTMVYMYYYKLGDVFSYFSSSVALANLARQDILTYFQAMVMENDWENYHRFFNVANGFPVNYVYIDDRTYLLVRMVSPLTLICMNSFVLTTAMVSTVAYGGVWKLYRMLVRYYPSLQGQLAFAVLFFPSSVFWGSGIVKDTFAFSGLCYYLHAMDIIFFQKKGNFGVWLTLVLGALLMVLLKPYVFMMLFPASLFWVLYRRVQRFKNVLIRASVLPMTSVALLLITLNVLQRLEGRLGKFSLERALDTVVVAQNDMKRSQYGANYFDLGNIEPTWNSVLSKFPQAVFAGLFRPLFNDVNNFAMLLSALENTFIVLVMLYILVRSKVVFFFQLILKNPLLQMCYLFAIGYAFMIAVTTPNFGAMVRFKIPLLPLFMTALFISKYILDKRREALAAGKSFSLDDYTDGDPIRGVYAGSGKAGKRPAGGRSSR